MTLKKRISLFLCIFFFCGIPTLSGCYGLKQAVRDTSSPNIEQKKRSFRYLTNYLRKHLQQDIGKAEKKMAIKSLGNHRQAESLELLLTMSLYEPELEHRIAAIRALAKLPTKKATDAIFKSMQEKDVRFRIELLRLLSKHPTKETLPVFLAATRDPKQKSVVIAGLQGLSRVLPLRSIPRLFQFYVGQTQPTEVRKAAKEAILQQGTKAFPFLDRVLKREETKKSKAEEHRKKVFALFAELGMKAFPKLLYYFRDFEFQLLAKPALVKLTQDIKSWDLLAKLLIKPNSKALRQQLTKQRKLYVLQALTSLWPKLPSLARLPLGETMGQIGKHLPQVSQPFFLKTIRNQRDLSLDCACLIGLGYLGKKAIRSLLPFLKTSQRSHIKCAIQAFGRMGKLGISTLVSFLDHEDEEFKLSAIQALSHIKEKEVLDKLIARLKQPSAKVRMHLAKALGVLGEKSAVPALRKLLHDPVGSVVLAAIQALIVLGDKQNAALYIAAIKHGPYPPKADDIRILSKLGKNEIILILKRLIARYLQDWKIQIKEAERLFSKLTRKLSYREKKKKRKALIKEVRLMMASKPAYQQATLCMVVEVFRGLLKRGSFPNKLLQKHGYSHKRGLSPLAKFPKTCPLPSPIKRLLRRFR